MLSHLMFKNGKADVIQYGGTPQERKVGFAKRWSRANPDFTSAYRFEVYTLDHKRVYSGPKMSEGLRALEEGL